MINNMRKLILQVQISIDGYIADVNSNTDWMIWNWGLNWTWDKELQQYFTDLKASIDCVLLSRKMAREGFIDHWAMVAGDTDSPQSAFAKSITNAHKVVFTKTLECSTWENTKLAKGDLATEVNKLKNHDGKNMIVYGGATLVSAMIKAKLVDEFQLFVNPVILGDGLAIFKEIDARQELMLMEARHYNCGIAVLKYVPRW
jgi:dihydrofolate reductase